MLIELPTTFFPGGRVDDFDGRGASSSGRGSEHRGLRLVHDEPVSLVGWRWVDVCTWGGRGGGL